jgi:hypothetical protein
LLPLLGLGSNRSHPIAWGGKRNALNYVRNWLIYEIDLYFSTSYTVLYVLVVVDIYSKCVDLLYSYFKKLGSKTIMKSF